MRLSEFFDLEVTNRADAIASLTAVHTEIANSNGGSPVVFVPRTFTLLP